MFNEIPTSRPTTPLLDTINDPADLRELADSQLTDVANQLRHFLLYSVGQTGGHFGAGLGVVELTVALHYVFNTPDDELIWDVGHQTYPHKILTGRRELMHTLRKPDGIAPFPARAESVYDVFGTGHSSTSISAALGIEQANRLNQKHSRTLVVIGDGAMTAGIAFEALNHVAACNANLLVILNDNAMSISENVGGLANYFARNLTGGMTPDQTQRTTGGTPGSIFTDLGFDYTGPVDGHDLDALVKTLTDLKDRPGPRLLHLITQKGKGYGPAEKSPVSSHALTKIEKHKPSAAAIQSTTTYAEVFGQWICDKAASDPKLIAITPAMKEGSGLTRFASEFPQRFHDVAIAEQHALTFAAGLAAGGAKPVVAIYSTFLQRAFDQLIHDIAIQNLDVTFAVDRACLLEDGPTHSGVFDLSFTRTIPNLTILAASSKQELEAMLDFAYAYPGPCMVRYPRGAASDATGGCEKIVRHTSELVKQGKMIALLVFGSLIEEARPVAESGNYTLINMRFIKPLDIAAINAVADNHQLIVTLEENAIAGGAGSAVNEYLAAAGINMPILNLGVPDAFISQDSPANMRETAGLSSEQIRQSIEGFMETKG